eukprot:g13592.t1
MALLGSSLASFLPKSSGLAIAQALEQTFTRRSIFGPPGQSYPVAEDQVERALLMEWIRTNTSSSDIIAAGMGMSALVRLHSLRGISEQVARRSLTEEVSPVLLAMVEPPPDDELRRGEQDAMGRYILEGPASKEAFSLLVECVRQGGLVPSSEMSRRVQELDLEARIEACRFVDYYLLPGRSKMQLTKELFGSLVGSEGFPREIEIQRCNLVDCDLSLTVTAGEVRISNSRLENVQLGVFSMVTSVENSSQLIRCNLRVVEELFVSDSELDACTFKGSDEDRKDRQFICAVFQQSELHGDVTLPFDKVVCEETYFHGKLLRMTKGGSSISLKRARLRMLPRIDCEGKINLSLEDCDLLDPCCFTVNLTAYKGC